MTVVYRLDSAPGVTGMGLIPPVAIVEIDADEELKDVCVGWENKTALALIRRGGVPIGQLALPVVGGICPASEVLKGIREILPVAYFNRSLENALWAVPGEKSLSIENLLGNDEYDVKVDEDVLASVAVCTRNRTEHLANCLESLLRLEHPNFEILVIDNAPDCDSTEVLVKEKFPDVRYITEPVPGLSHARNTALAHARGKYLAFTDDDVVVDPHWLRSISQVFNACKEVAVVTGLIIPLGLENEAQLLLEKHWSFNRGYRRLWYQCKKDLQVQHVEAFQYGAGANMAVDCDWARQTGGFDVKLGAGTNAQGGEDVDIFFRALVTGRVLVYEPESLVYHRHRDTMHTVKEQVVSWGKGYGAYLRRALISYPEARTVVLRYLYHSIKGQLRDLLVRHLVPGSAPPHFWRGQVIAWFKGFLTVSNSSIPVTGTYPDPCSNKGKKMEEKSTAIRSIDISKGLSRLDGLESFDVVKVRVCRSHTLFGELSFENAGQSISARELKDRIINELGLLMVKPERSISDDQIWTEFKEKLRQKLGLKQTVEFEQTQLHGQSWPSVSVILPTRDRPDQLRQCLNSLVNQVDIDDYEIVVVDNNPDSGLTRAVTDEFPEVTLVPEHGKGASRARNTGCRMSSGDIIAMIDDDVIVPSNWLHKIVSCFDREDVYLVTGNVLPWQLDSMAEKVFEFYMGFSRGREPVFYGPDFFQNQGCRVVPVWAIGASANMAVRRDIVFLRQNGSLMSEHLGPGSYAESAEDIYLLYLTLLEGYTVKYDPEAFAYHQHRATMREFYQQAYNYGKGHYAFQSLCLIKNRDFRALYHMLFYYPVLHFRRLLGFQRYPRKLLALEVLGNIAGPLCLLRSKMKKASRVQTEIIEARLKQKSS